MIWLVIIPGAALMVWLLVSAARQHACWKQDKRDHRRWGGTAPKK